MGSTGTPGRTGVVGGLSPEAVLEAVVEISDDAIFTCDLTGRILSWSAPAVRLFGPTPGHAIGAPFASLFPGHLQDEARSLTARVVAGDRIRHFETEVLRADGMPMPVSLSLEAVLDSDDRPLGVAVIARDITEQRLTQATLAEVEARLEEGEALAHVGSWLWDLRTGTVQWSSEFYRIHGVDPLEFDGTLEAHLAVVAAPDRSRVRAAMEESVVSGRAFECEYRIAFAGGGIRWLRARAQPTVGSAGVAVGLRGIGEDFTDRAPAGG
jgi:PAS domain S-box-containing protein